jgi:hypothetical protein
MMATVSHWQWQDVVVPVRAPWSCAIPIIGVLLTRGYDNCCSSLSHNDSYSGRLDCLLRCCLCCSNASLTCLGIGCCSSNNNCSLVS